MLRAPRRLDRLAEFFCRHNAKCLQNSVCFVLVASGTTDCKLCLDHTRFVSRLDQTIAPVRENCTTTTILVASTAHDRNTTTPPTSSPINFTMLPNFDQNTVHSNLPTQSACQRPAPPSDSTRSIQPQITTGPKGKPSSELDALLSAPEKGQPAQRRDHAVCFGNGNGNGLK